MTKTLMMVGLMVMGALGAATARAGAIEDDLAVVKRAVTADKKAEKGATAENRSARSGRKPLWLRVRILEKGPGGDKISISLPLSLTRTLAGKTAHWKTGNKKLDLGQILERLGSGQDLILIEDEDTTVRVWLE